VQQKAIRIYWVGSFLAVWEAFVLFMLGMDLSFYQIQIFIFFIAPIPLICMYALDNWLITHHTRPIDEAWQKLQNNEEMSYQEQSIAYIQAINLPILTLLRVLIIHPPSVLLPITILCLIANQELDLGFSWSQFFVLWAFWPIVSVPHAMVEYFLIDRFIQRCLAQLAGTQHDFLSTATPHSSLRVVLRTLFGQPPTTAQVIRMSTGLQLAWILFFVSLMPMFVLGTSVYLKLAIPDVPVAQLLPKLGGWMALLMVLNTAISATIVTLMSQRIRRAMRTLLADMQRVLEGDLSQMWRPQTTDEFFDLGMGFNAMVKGLRERETIKDTFGRFVSRDVAQAVLENRIAFQGELRQVTILFQDIRGFTSLSERTPPAALLAMLNVFFTEMVAAVESHGGIVKQFTGDGVMALFGAPVQHPDDPSRAVQAAIDMLRRLDGFNQQRAQAGAATLRIGIGIHTGEVVAGPIGPDTRMEYGVVGDAVNLASRVQELTKEVGAAILVTDTTAAYLEEQFQFGAQAVLPVRGKAEPIRVLEIVVPI
jgi:class 3 adenylate cyclase